MNVIAKELNDAICVGNPHVFPMLSKIGRELFFPKGILSQSAEAKLKAHRINATIGIAKENGRTMRFDSVMDMIAGITAEDSLTYAPSFGIPARLSRWSRRPPSAASSRSKSSAAFSSAFPPMNL